MRLAWLTVPFLAAACVSAPVASAGDNSLQEGRLVVEKMLDAIQKRDSRAFNSVVLKDAVILFGHMGQPLELDIPPKELGCGAPTITGAEPSELDDKGVAVTVLWQCLPRLPEFNGKMAIKFHVGAGKVQMGERVNV